MWNKCWSAKKTAIKHILCEMKLKCISQQPKWTFLAPYTRFRRTSIFFLQNTIFFLWMQYFFYNPPLFLWVRYFSYQVNIFPTRYTFFSKELPPSPSDRTSPICARSFEGTCTQCTFPQRNVFPQVPESLHPVGKRASESVGNVFPMEFCRKVFSSRPFHRKQYFS